MNDIPIELTYCDKEHYYTFEENTATQFLSTVTEETCNEFEFEGTWSENTPGFIIITFNDPRDSAYIIMNDEETEIDEIVKITLPDDTAEERLYIYTKRQ